MLLPPAATAAADIVGTAVGLLAQLERISDER